MKDISIYVSDNSDLAEYKAVSKGYRVDIYVEIGADIFNVHMYTMIRLQQDFESEIEEYGFFAAEPNLILVEEANRDEMVNTIYELYKQGFFSKCKPIIRGDDLNKLYKVN